MALFVKELASPYILKEMENRLVVTKVAATNISADVPEIAWNGSEITFPIYSRTAVADAVAAKGSVTPVEIDGTSAKAAITHYAASSTFHKDALRMSGGAVLQNMVLRDLSDAMAAKLDLAMVQTAIAGATLKSACAAADAITSDELENAFALFGDHQNVDEFAGVFINSKLFPSLLKMDGFASDNLTYTQNNNGIVRKQCAGYYRGIPVFLTNNGTRTADECKTLIVQRGALAYAQKSGVDIHEDYNGTSFMFTETADIYAAHKVLDDSKLVVLAKTIA
jgi:hypothetical protein